MSPRNAQEKELPSADAFTYIDIQEARLVESNHTDILIEQEAEPVTAEVAAAIAIRATTGKQEDSKPATPCYGMSELFFPTSPTETVVQRDARVKRAKSICSDCKIKTACLDGARVRREEWGVWGGEEFSKGKIVRRT